MQQHDPNLYQQMCNAILSQREHIISQREANYALQRWIKMQDRRRFQELMERWNDN